MIFVLIGGFILLFVGVGLAKSSDKRGEPQIETSAGTGLLSVGLSESSSERNNHQIDMPCVVLARVIMLAGFVAIIWGGASLV